jgi:glucose-1-phosphate adenylyltransferase
LTEITNQTIALVLAGGVGSRLHPLTEHRTKPAVPFGGKYRIIDFTLSNCLESGLRRILVLTQYKSHSLQKHLRDGWSIFNPSLGEYITPVPPQMRTGERWYSGTADAVFQNLYLVERSLAQWVLILSGDHIYRMDYAAMLASHRERGAGITVACMRVPLGDASSFGVVAVDESERIVKFEEKPASPSPMPSSPDEALVSMGVYVFSAGLLEAALELDGRVGAGDFGKDILPRMLLDVPVFAYLFGGESGRVTADRYWRDVGTLDAYYDANQDLVQPVPAMNLYQPDWKIRTYETQNPPARTTLGASGQDGDCVNSMVCSGTIIAGARVTGSILSPNVRVCDSAEVDDSILFDGVEVGAGARLRRVIVDKFVRIPAGEQIGMDLDRDARRFTVSENGVVVIPRMYEFPA